MRAITFCSGLYLMLAIGCADECTLPEPEPEQEVIILQPGEAIELHFDIDPATGKAKEVRRIRKPPVKQKIKKAGRVMWVEQT